MNSNLKSQTKISGEDNIKNGIERELTLYVVIKLLPNTYEKEKKVENITLLVKCKIGYR